MEYLHVAMSLEWHDNLTKARFPLAELPGRQHGQPTRVVETGLNVWLFDWLGELHSDYTRLALTIESWNQQ